MFKIRCNPMHPLYGALPVPYVPVLAALGALVAHRYTYAPPRCRTSQYYGTFIPFWMSLWNDLADLAFDAVGLAGFKRRANAFLLVWATHSHFVLYWFPFLFLGWYCGAEVFGLRGRKSLFPSIALPTIFSTTTNNNNAEKTQLSRIGETFKWLIILVDVKFSAINHLPKLVWNITVIVKKCHKLFYIGCSESNNLNCGDVYLSTCMCRLQSLKRSLSDL